MKTTNTDTILLSMLRQKQQRLNIYYPTRQSRFYKVLHILFYVFFGICTAINILSIISWWSKLSSDLSVLQNPTSVQQSAISEIKDGIKTVIILGILLIGAPIFSKLKKTVPTLCFTAIPSALLLSTFANRLSKNIDAGNYTFFIYVHLLPILLFIIFEIVLAIIEINQKIKDKKGMEEIASRIYEKYSIMAESITEEQWNTILSEYQPTLRKTKEKKVKISKSKEKPEKVKTEV